MKDINIVELVKLLKENEDMLGYDYDKETKTIRLFSSSPTLVRYINNEFKHPHVVVLCGKKGKPRR
jgi:hypothetical protein